jgi:phosphohistidine swiveling domain-containing protein
MKPDASQTQTSEPPDSTCGSGVEGLPPPLGTELTPALQTELLSLNQSLRSAFVRMAADEARADTVRQYLGIKKQVAQVIGRFGIVNNTVYRSGDQLIVPYLARETLVVLAVRESETTTLAACDPPAGTIYTDRLLERLAGFRGEPIDLEHRIFGFDAEQAQTVRISRIRDLGDLLRRVNETTNRTEAVYFLRFLVARVCNPAFEALVGAKNLQPEVRRLTTELARFLDRPLARRVPLLVRLLVRNISSLILKPNLIDRLWNDTIDLAEIHVPGSSIANELRRSTHHALGKRTLTLARAYLAYLSDGDVEELDRVGYGTPAPADRKAREREAARRLVARIVEDLESLLGTAQVVSGIREWEQEYHAALLRCEFGRSIADEMEEVVRAARERNRWAYYHHLRILRRKGQEFSSPEDARDAFLSGVESLLALAPDDQALDLEGAVSRVRVSVQDFADRLRDEYTGRLFPALDTVLDSYERGEQFETFGQIRTLRRSLWDLIDHAGFREQRYFLYQLDCLLEEMGYLALAHVSTGYAESGIDILQCLEIIRLTVLNLAFDGKYSRELVDLAVMLSTPSRTYAEIENLLECIQHNYHKIVQRVSAPYEKMRERLGLDEEELRVVLGNMKRYMHDLNCMVQFCDLARTYILEHVSDTSRPVVAAAASGTTEDLPIVHLSHEKAITALVERDGGPLTLREVYGSKGTGLIYISHLKIPTRDGFLLPTTIAKSARHLQDSGWLKEQVIEHLRVLEDDVSAIAGTARRYGDAQSPLILAVRSGSVFSMPGILPTAVFVGMNDDIAAGLARDDPWHAYDSYRRFLASFAKTVWNVDIESYGLVDAAKRECGVSYKKDLPWKAMKDVAETSKTILRDKGLGAELNRVLDAPLEQVLAAVRAAFASWDRETPRRYRAIKGICDSWHTAVVIQEMASGNRQNEDVRDGMDETSASLTGVIPHTRLTDRGVRLFAGEIKFSAAGDDLVGGVIRPTSFRTMRELNTLMPMLNRRLRHTVAKLRRFQGTDQEIEFTVERGVLSVLQSRSAEIAADQKVTAFVDPGPEVTRGIGIRGGGFRGLAAFDDKDWQELSEIDLAARADVDGILMVIDNPSPDDIPMILQGGGLLTAKGGSSSHAAVAINGMEKSYAAVMSAVGLRVDAPKHEAVIVDEAGAVLHCIRKGDVVSIHGTTGEVYAGSRALQV